MEIHRLPPIIRWVVCRLAFVFRRDRQAAEKISSQARQGNLSAVKALLEQNPRLANALACYEDRPLFGAAVNKEIETVKLLLAARAKVNAVRSDGETALHGAAQSADAATVELLLEHGADINARNDSGETPLLCAAGHERREIMALLLDRGADIEAKDKAGETAFISRATLGGLQTAEWLLQRGAQPSPEGLLFMDIMRGNAAAVDQCLTRHPKLIGRIRENNASMLHLAVKCGHIAVVETLLNRGMDVDVQLEDYMAPIHWAASYGEEAILELLIRRGARSDAPDAYSKTTPLGKAASAGHISIIERLLELGAKIDSKDSQGLTPLAWAIINRRPAAIRALLAHGANLYIIDSDGESLLERGMATENAEIVELMWEYR